MNCSSPTILEFAVRDKSHLRHIYYDVSKILGAGHKQSLVVCSPLRGFSNIYAIEILKTHFDSQILIFKYLKYQFYFMF